MEIQKCEFGAFHLNPMFLIECNRYCAFLIEVDGLGLLALE
jgi:hypothetical protein